MRNRPLILARDAMRTRFEIALADEDRSEADRRAAGEEALDEIEHVEAMLSAYRPHTDLYTANSHAALRPVRVDARVMEFLRRARGLSIATGGAFDPTVGPLLFAWGLGGGATIGRVPTDREIGDALALTGMERHVTLDCDARTIAFDRPGVRLDPGAIGKGYALERAADLLREAGIRSALLHGGTSTVCATGSPPDRPQGWRVAIQHPRRPESHLATVDLNDTSLSVSAVHGKTFYADGRTFGHVIDPRRGRPVEESVLAAVVAPSATDTDALSTALLVLGAEGLAPLAARFPDAAFLVAYDDGGGKGLRVACAGPPGWRDLSEDRPGRA